MSEVNYQALREAAQNYQSMRAWYQTSPEAQMLNGIVMRLWLRLSVTSVIGKRILSLICWMNWKKQNHSSTSSVSITKALSRMEVNASQNWKKSNLLRKNWFAAKASITVSKTIVRRLHCLA